MRRIHNALHNLPYVFASLLIMFTTLSLTGCGDNETGISGGALNGIIHDGVYEDCNSGSSSASSEGKSIDIDGVTIKMPIDYNYANTHQSDYHGNNWSGDDAARGIGIFNCNEEGDGSEAFANSYAINMRWEYCSYDSVDGAYPAHANYTGTDGDITVGGTSASCVSGGRILGQSVDSSQASATAKLKIIVYNPETGKACVCAPGFNAYDSGSTNCNWGGAPLALLGGITSAVSNAVGAEQNKTVLELYFTDPDTALGPCEFSGGSSSAAVSSSKSNSKCGDSFIDASSTANLAVSAAYDVNNPSFTGHEMITDQISGSNGSAHAPTTARAQMLRGLATGGSDNHSADCGFFVSSIVRLTEDKDYPLGDTDIQQSYCENHTDKWQRVLTGIYSRDIPSLESQLQPGDVLITARGHTVMYVGNDAIKAQFPYISSSYVIVAASQDSHGPQIQTPNDDTRPYEVYRFIGTPDPLDAASQINS